MSIVSNEDYKVVARMGVEPMIFGMRIRRPRPLDERAMYTSILDYCYLFQFSIKIDISMDAQKKILLVEDEALIRELYTRQLSKAGFMVKPAATGEEAVQILKAATFDVILLDIMLPGINGLKVLKEFKVLYPNTATIVVLLTNLGQDSIIKEGFDLGASAYLIKTSYTPDQIVSEVQSIISGKPAGGNQPPIPGA